MGRTAGIDEPSINGYQAEEYAWEEMGDPENEFLDRPDNAAKTLYRFVVGMRRRSRSFSSPVDEPRRVEGARGGRGKGEG